MPGNDRVRRPDRVYRASDDGHRRALEHGEVLGQSLGLPLFLGNLEICVKLMAEEFGWDYFKEGDVFYMNDSYMTGTHLNDSTIIMPIFWRGKRVGFAASQAHWLAGGMLLFSFLVLLVFVMQGMSWLAHRIGGEEQYQPESGPTSAPAPIVTREAMLA